MWCLRFGCWSRLCRQTRFNGQKTDLFHVRKFIIIIYGDNELNQIFVFQVAITIYWLGKQALDFYEGPLLDITAFSALVKNHSKDLLSDCQYPHESWDSLDHSTSFNDSHPNEESLNASKSHLDSSYDSYGSYGRVSADSLDSPSEAINMPVREDTEYDSSRDARMNSSLYPKDKKSVDRPGSLSPGYHARSSSTDSLDGSLLGNHSSGSVDNYTTRPSERKTSAANANPLQFIKTSADELAMRAVEQSKLAEENKRITPVTTTRVADEDDGSWREVRMTENIVLRSLCTHWKVCVKLSVKLI